MLFLGPLKNKNYIIVRLYYKTLITLLIHILASTEMSLKAEESGYSSHNDGSGSGSGPNLSPPASPLASPTRSSPVASPIPPHTNCGHPEENNSHYGTAHFGTSQIRSIHQPIQLLSHQPMVISAPSSNTHNLPQGKKIWSLAEMSSSSNSNVSEDEEEEEEKEIEEIQVN